MTQTFTKTKPSLMEAGLPCVALSAECQSDNDARQRPPQNRLHVWWARRPPTICRVAILTALLPHDADLTTDGTREFDPPVSEADLETLSTKERDQLEVYRRLLADIPPTALTEKHKQLMLLLRAFGDPARFAEHRAAARALGVPLPRAFSKYLSSNRDTSIPEGMLVDLRKVWAKTFGLADDEAPVLLDSMAGGGAIPLEGVQYGLKVYANELNPVAALVLKATLEYPARFGARLAPAIRGSALDIAMKVRARLEKFFPFPPASEWWPEIEQAARAKFNSKTVVSIEPGDSARQIKNSYLWCRTLRCPKCELTIPLSTNFTLDTKSRPETHKAAFPETPPLGRGNDCTFRIVAFAEWKDCRWPRLGNDPWHPRKTPTFQDGHAICPRCGTVIDESDVKKTAQSKVGGLPSQMMAVCSQVPVKLTYRDGSVKTRYLWRFRSPTPGDLAAAQAAEQELAANETRWANLIPPERVPRIMEDRRPIEYGMLRWRDFFAPRQMLTVLTVLDEVRAAGNKARSEMAPAEAEAVAVYLALIISKIVNYNSVSASWHDGRRTVRGTMMGHDLRFHAGFAEFEGAREPVLWGASQVINAYTQLAGLIHGEAVPQGEDDEQVEGGEPEEEGEPTDDTDEEATPATVLPTNGEVHLRPEVIVPTVTCNDAAALETPAPGTVHVICVDPPYYNNVQYAELSNFFYVWIKRALGDWPGLEHLFREELAETNREAVANAVRWKAEAEKEQAVWQERFDRAFESLADARGDNGRKLPLAERRRRAVEITGPKPLNAAERAERFYEGKMAAVFRRAKQLLHPAGRMVVMFNHKMTKAWRALGKALIEAGFEIRTSIPIHTEAESSLNIRGLDAARSTVLLLCLPRQDAGQVTGNWGRVQERIASVARNAAQHFQKQGIAGTDLYLSALGPTLGEVGRHWPITDMAGRAVDLTDALDRAYRAVGQFRLDQILTQELPAKIGGMVEGFAADAADRNTQALWLWLDTFQGDIADSDDVRKLAKSLDIEPDVFKKLKLIESESDLFYLKPPQDVDLAQLARQQSGEKVARGRAAREGDVWEERKFPNFLGAAVWNAVSLLAGGDELHRGVEPLKQWLRASDYGDMPEFRGAYAVTLYLLEQAFGRRKEDDPWRKAATEARRGWDLVLRDWRG
jgi:adenine-specific DNA methylase